MSINTFKNKIHQKIVLTATTAMFICLICTPLNIIGQSSAGWEQKYDVQKSEVQSRIDSVNSEMAILNQNLAATTQKKNTLSEQKASIQDTILKTDELIKTTELAIKELAIQITETEKEIKNINIKIGGILVDVQAKNKSPVEILLSSMDFAQTISEIASLNTLNDQLKTLRNELADKKTILESSKKTQEETKQAQQAAQALNNSKKDELEILIAQTQNDEIKYQEYLKGLAGQKMAFDVQIKNIENAKVAEAAEIEKKRLEEEARQAQLKREREAAALAAQMQANLGNLRTSPGANSTNQRAYGNAKNEGYACALVNETSNTIGIGSSWTAPATGYITSGFGCGTGIDGAHDGIDIANSMRTPIYSIGDGVVIKSVASGCVAYGCGGLANYVVIKHTFSNRNVYSVYGHLYAAPAVSVGQTVTKGQQIGEMGSTGYSSGPHLHFSIIDESFERGTGANCNRIYSSNASTCFNPFEAPFKLY